VTNDELRPREHVPDINAAADEIVMDIRTDNRDTGQGELDAIGTISALGLDFDDVCRLVIVLARRVADAGI
jgi:hypothetical protein